MCLGDREKEIWRKIMGIGLVAGLQSLGMERVAMATGTPQARCWNREGKCSYCFLSYDTCYASALSFKGC